MATPKKKRNGKQGRLEKIDPSSHPALENLVERLSSPRLKAPGTITTYVVTAANFLKHLKGGPVPTESDFRQFFIRRRREGIGELTLRKDFFILQKLARANKWPWPFDRDDAPYDEEKKKLPVMRRETVEQLIKAKALLTKAERFYLAVATTWLVRREELTRIKKIDFDDNTIFINTAKHGKKARHLIPDVLKPVFAEYRPKEHNPASLSEMFRRICSKAGVELRPREGWHAIRYSLNTILESTLPRRVLSDFSHWKTISSGESQADRGMRGEDMIERYRRSEILDDDPFYADKVVYSVHPFLPLWSKDSPTKLRQRGN